jgi:DNA polymerase I
VARELLKSEKLEIGGPAEIKAHWEGGPEKLNKLIEYCIRDSELALRLVTEKGLLDKFYELAKVSGLLLQDAFGGQAQRHECKLLYAFKQRDIVMPCKPEGDEMRRRRIEREKVGLKGAVVLEPSVGLHTGGCVLVLDFASLYPSIIRSFNICPTTYVRSETDVKFHTSPNGARFVDKEVREGILPAVVKELVETRAAVKDQMKAVTDAEIKRQLNAKQLALKDMANSLYGYTGYIRSRLYVMDVAGAITGYGRENIAKTKELVEKSFDVKVLYGDTDSLLMKTDIADLDRAQQKGEEIAAYVTERLPGLKFAFEKIFKTFLILSKKRYAGWKFEKTAEGWKDKIEMKGIETVRRDWCELTTESMSEVLRIILKEQDAKKAIIYTRGVVKSLSERKVPLEKLAVVKGVTKSISAYDGIQPHVELAKKIMARDPSKGSMVGERLSYVIVKGNALLSMRAEDPAYVKANGLEIDSQYYVENQLLPPLERIFDALGVSRIEVLEGVRQKNLAEMFGGAQKSSAPEQTILDSWEKIACVKCGWASNTPSLSGVCPKCGDQIFFSKGGELGKFVKN